MKLILLFLLLIPFCISAQISKQYLVTTQGDTIYYQGDLEVDHAVIYKWRNISIDSVNYPIGKIKAAYFNQQFYYNCNGRALCKQVINGKIKVYAKTDADTIADRNGNLRYPVYIQQGDKKPVVLNNIHLLDMVDDAELEATLNKRVVNSRGGKAMMIVGISGGAPLAVGGAFVALLSALFSDNEAANTALIVSGAAILVGGALIGGGIGLKAGNKKMNLGMIHAYNNK